jgi:translation initiation factor 3 subunit D
VRVALTANRRETYGRVFAYDKSYDRITTKTEKPLQLVDRIKYNTTTSDDPVIQQVKIQTSGKSLVTADRILPIACEQEYR